MWLWRAEDDEGEVLDGGAEHWAVLASLIETAKLNGLDPRCWQADDKFSPL